MEQFGCPKRRFKQAIKKRKLLVCPGEPKPSRALGQSSIGETVPKPLKKDPN